MSDKAHRAWILELNRRLNQLDEYKEWRRENMNQMEHEQQSEILNKGIEMNAKYSDPLIEYDMIIPKLKVTAPIQELVNSRLGKDFLKDKIKIIIESIDWQLRVLVLHESLLKEHEHFMHRLEGLKLMCPEINFNPSSYKLHAVSGYGTHVKLLLELKKTLLTFLEGETHVK